MEVQLPEVASTNLYCEALDLDKVEDFTCYWTLRQTAGRGQQGNRWHSSPDRNIAFSLVLHPQQLDAASQFVLTQMLSLAVTDWLATLGIEANIKWPNDIYVGDKKLCGILTSVRVQGGKVQSAVCGVGVNVMESDFPQWIPNPTSLTMLGHPLPPRVALRQLLAAISVRYCQLQQGCDFQREYLGRLYRFGVEAEYLIGDRRVAATITGVNPFGHLQLRDADGQCHSCAMKEIKFL